MQVRRPDAFHPDDSAFEVARRAHKSAGYLFEPLEPRQIAGATAMLLPDGLALATPNGSQEIVDAVFARPAAAAAATDAPAASPALPPQLPAEADPLSAVGDPAKGARPKKGTVTTLEETSSGSGGSSTTGLNSRMYVTIDKVSPFPGPREGGVQQVSNFIINVTAECSAGPFPASVTVHWFLNGTLSDEASPGTDYTGSILDESRTITIDQETGTGSTLVSIEGINDNLDEIPNESVIISIDDATATPDADTPDGMTVVVTKSQEYTEVFSGDFTITTDVGGTVRSSTMVSVSGTPPNATTSDITATITWGGQPVGGVDVALKLDRFDPNTQAVIVDATNPGNEHTAWVVTTGNDGKATFTVKAKQAPASGPQNKAHYLVRVQNAEGQIQAKEFRVYVVP